MLSVRDVLLCVESHEGQVQNKRHPVSINEEQYCQECVHSSFRHNVRIQAVAEVNGVYVVAGDMVSTSIPD